MCYLDPEHRAGAPRSARERLWRQPAPSGTPAEPGVIGYARLAVARWRRDWQARLEAMRRDREAFLRALELAHGGEPGRPPKKGA